MVGMGEILVITVAVHHNPKFLPELSEKVIPVQIYGLNGRQQENIAAKNIFVLIVDHVG